MTSFVNIKYSTQHPGVVRAESAFGAVRQLAHAVSGTRGLATLLLSAIAAAVMVVAYQVMDSVTEGHLLVMWIGVWVVAFAVLALFAGAARNAAVSLKTGLDAWSRSMAEARADQRLWQAARNDPRVMADLQMALLRGQAEAEVADAAVAAPAGAASAPAGLTQRALRVGGAELQAYLQSAKADAQVAAPAAVEAVAAGLTQRARRLGGAELRAYQRNYI
ncbi:hypothetical protein SAMN05216350_104280 [Polaromonas sp. YR568]|uniref:hypothetical protein n=1 Tax=Polaromonas sp. YR568 TaxID=1855301 RepID=UPI0008F0AA4A|nr:hypothetical protein [Polaromonas sp. YR568]SFU74059.1 hypothetical protein SAMN05216350_104280 [Polaromonas sp. YR568]